MTRTSRANPFFSPHLGARSDTLGGEYISGNATLPEGWKNLDKYIEKNGKFDFV